MKTFTLISLSIFLFLRFDAFGQEENSHVIRTIFSNRGPSASGGYLAATNKFTTINGNYANIVELYGGWYINHRWLIGVGAAASTNNLPVQKQHSVNPAYDMSYEYGQCGLMTEYVIGSNRAVHLAVQLFTGGGFTLQYQREDLQHDDYWSGFEDYDHDENWFAVAEPGVKVEVNVFRWLRFSPGVSYRIAYGSGGSGLSDESLGGTNVNMTLKFGKF
jgi:hypothetical protein